MKKLNMFVALCGSMDENVLEILERRDYYKVGKIIMMEIVKGEVLKDMYKVNEVDIKKYLKNMEWQAEYLGKRFFNEIEWEK